MDAFVEPGLVHGIYSYREAARLLCVTSQRVARWADGYTFRRKYDVGWSGPILQTDRSDKVLSFPELWELFFVREYVACGVPLARVRDTSEALANEVGPFPFSTAGVMVSGTELLVRTAQGNLYSPDIGQLVADYAAQLCRHVKFFDDRVGRYTIPDFDGVIYLDQRLRGGEPVATELGVPTRLIHSMWEAELDISAVAEYFDIPAGDVSAAIRFEGQGRLTA